MSTPQIRPGGYPITTVPPNGLLGAKPAPSRGDLLGSQPNIQQPKLGPENGFQFYNEKNHPPEGFAPTRRELDSPPKSPYQSAPPTAAHSGLAKLSVWIEGARGLKGGDWFSKSDPYCVCELSETKKFQTNVLDGAGPDPQWHFGPTHLDYHGEHELHFSVFDKDTKYDDLLGRASLPSKQFMAPGGFDGEIALSDGTKHKGGTLRVQIKFEEGQSSGAPLSPPQHARNPVGGSGVERQWQELLEGQRRLQEDMVNMQSQMNNNYRQCMEETQQLRKEIAQGSFATNAGPYSGSHGYQQPPPYQQDRGLDPYGAPSQRPNYDRSYNDRSYDRSYNDRTQNFNSQNFNTKSSMKTTKGDRELVEKSHRYICC
jgi:hypothetical protein